MSPRTEGPGYPQNIFASCRKGREGNWLKHSFDRVGYLWFQQLQAPDLSLGARLYQVFRNTIPKGPRMEPVSLDPAKNRTHIEVIVLVPLLDGHT